MQCIVCNTKMAQGNQPWHTVCPACHYENAHLTPGINLASRHQLVNETDREDALKPVRQANFRQILGRLKTLFPTGGMHLLDVGSAHGWFLEEASGYFKVLGIEPDAHVGGEAAARGLPVRTGYFPDALAQDEQFDLIIFNDVIEHIPDIKTALAACHDHLATDGLLVLNLPDSRGFFYRLSKRLARIGHTAPFERIWQKGLPSPHVHYFTADNLQRLLSPEGFQEICRFELPVLSSQGLLARLRFAGHINPILLYTQFVVISCLIPLLKWFPSDIMVSIFRKEPRKGATTD